MRKTRHWLTGAEFSREDLMGLLETAEICRRQRYDGALRNDLSGRSVILLFEKPSLRTRVSFTVAVQELGGQVLVVDSLNKKTEEPEDTVRVLGGYCHAVMIRTHAHSNLERMASKSPIPIVNGLSDTHHPCQALADLQTLRQTYGDLKGLKLAYVGDGNNVLHSLLLLAPYLGVEVHYACPKGFEPNSLIVKKSKTRAKDGGGLVQAHATAEDAVRGANAVYTDVWTSMGFEQEEIDRDKFFAKYALTEELYALAKPGALIMHCMPMVRDKEIASSLVEHECSALFRQSENRMHVQKALLMNLMK